MAGLKTDALKIPITIDKQYQAAIKDMEGKFLKAGVAMAGSLTAIGAGLVAITQDVANLGEELLKWSQITGVNVRELSKLRELTKRSGGEIEDMYDVLKELNIKMKEAQDGTGAFSDNIKHLKVEFQESNGELRNTLVVFQEVTKRLNEIENASLRTAIADELFSDAGTKLLPIILDKNQAIQDLTKNVGDYNEMISLETAKAAKEFNDTMRNTKSQVEGLGISIGTILLPPLAASAQWWAENLKGATDYFKAIDNREILELDKQLAILTKDLEEAREELKDYGGERSTVVIGIKAEIAALNELRAARLGVGAGAKTTPTTGIDPDKDGTTAVHDKKIADEALSFAAQLDRELHKMNVAAINLAAETDQERFDNELSLFASNLDAELLAQQHHDEEMRAIEVAQQQFMADARQNEVEDTKRTEQLKAMAQRQGANASISLLESLNTIAQGKHRGYFETLKVARASEAGINAFTAASRALADYPYPYSAIVAGIVGLAGAAQVTAIMSQQFEGGGGMAAHPTISGGGGGAITQTVPTAPALPEEQRAQQWTVIIQNPIGDEDWDDIAEKKMIPAFNRAAERNVNIQVTQ